MSGQTSSGMNQGMERFRELVKTRLAAASIRMLEENGRRRAAVLISLLEKEGEPHLLLTLRSNDVATHKGQISFPGGMCDEDDESLRSTAVRETSEELGIEEKHVQVFGRFHDCLSVNNVLVTPFVGFLDAEARLAPNPREVQEIIVAPVSFFQSTTPRSEVRERNGRRMRLYFYDFGPHVVWGLTARIIKELVSLLDGRTEAS